MARLARMTLLVPLITGPITEWIDVKNELRGQGYIGWQWRDWDPLAEKLQVL